MAQNLHELRKKSFKLTLLVFQYVILSRKNLDKSRFLSVSAIFVILDKW